MGKYTRREDGRYCTHIDAGYNEDGSRRRVTLYGSSIKELDRKVTETRMRLSGGYNPNTITMDIYANDWLTTYKSTRRDNTLQMYRNALDVHIIPALGRIELSKLTASDVQRLINTISDRPRTCEIVRTTLRQIIRHAVADGYMLRDVTQFVELPKKEVAKKRALYQHEKDAITRANLDPDERAFLNILYGCGLRREEALALRVKDITGTAVKVCRSVTFSANGAPTINDMLKSTTSRREVPIPQSVYFAIRKYIASLSTIDQDTMLFARYGGPMSKAMYRRWWANIVKKISEVSEDPISGLTAHIFRHNYITMLYYSNVSIIQAAKLVGHKDTKLILQVYAHLDEEKENTQNKINAIFSAQL